VSPEDKFLSGQKMDQLYSLINVDQMVFIMLPLYNALQNVNLDGTIAAEKKEEIPQLLYVL
jgi:hypothetical protein